ncbi:MAG: hypothetical protein M1834_007669 [Cirrosporium novae-zelandiae]|nr:MAG: hypothetical protein M1834_007669 [Cirrosporium novae-zelandiae]
MAVKSPLVPSPNGLMHHLSPYTNPSGTASPRKISRTPYMSPGRLENLLSPSAGTPYPPPTSAEIYEPSPIATSSVGTEITEIDDDSTSDTQETPLTQYTSEPGTPAKEVKANQNSPSSSSSRESINLKIKTYQNALNPYRPPQLDEDEPPQSVIHAPPGFKDFVGRGTQRTTPSRDRSSSSPSQKSDATVTSPAALKLDGGRKGPISPPPITTAVRTPRDWTERATPRAQTRQEVEALEFEVKEHSRKNSLEGIASSSSSLRPYGLFYVDIPEGHDTEVLSEEDGKAEAEEVMGDAISPEATEVAALQNALSECWTLCNTLAYLSNLHRQQQRQRKNSNFSDASNSEEAAWKSCWKLCQNLYTQATSQVSTVGPTLELTRDFCVTLFEARTRPASNSLSDSVLRVSFELNNHLFNTHDRSLPDAFRERTLDFYITLCHRLMKQRPLPPTAQPTSESLLHASWTLAEMFFSLRQTARDEETTNPNLLGSAIQACWDLCDLFREGWTQIRPDRGTPRPSQTTFTQAVHQARRAEMAAASSNSTSVPSNGTTPSKQHPETPTTIFEDTQTISPDEAPVPNIVVLGRDANQGAPTNATPSTNNWSSAASSLSTTSTYASARSAHTTSTVTSPTPHLPSLHFLLIRAAFIAGYSRTLSPPISLHTFVRSLPQDAFGPLPWQTSLLQKYRSLVLNDPGLREVGPRRKLRVREIKESVEWLVTRRVEFGWLRDLGRWVFGDGEAGTSGEWVEG